MTPTIPDVDLTDGNFYATGQARAAYRWMRAHQPVFRDCNGLAAASTYKAVMGAERDPNLFSNAGGIRPNLGPLPQMIDMDDPAHLLRRKLVHAGFKRKRVKDKEESLRALVDVLIDAVCEKGECDFVKDLAAPMPMAVIGDMLGVRPEQREMFLKWSDDLMVALSSTVTEDNQQASANAYAAYVPFMLETIAARRREPTDDLTSVLVHAEIDGERLTDDQIVAETLLILIGGDESTRHTLSGGTEQLLRNPDQWDLLQRDPDLLPGAVEEMLRWTSPVKNMCRTLTADADFCGTQVHKGEKMMLLFESANFDESVFGDPENFRIERNPNNHLAFGFGSHFCLGNQLARLEMTLMAARVLQRLPDLRLADSAALPLRPSNFVSGLVSMPVTFTPTTPVSAD
jgi:cytochrome P450 family 142 subfamily A polypeptide 1